MAPTTIPPLLLPRQSTTSGCSCPNTLDGGAIAGIVIGSIAGTLLLIWLWRTCMVTSALSEAEKTGGVVPGQVLLGANGNGYPSNEETTHYRRRRRRGASPGYEYEYAEKQPYRGRSGGSVKRPRRVYLAS
ncbi:uncharacterized protein BJX67DRAFT_197592 [Aspergillus lucknowensis]|uniref:Uncharacterized protein n=1 Tax=Aspergillus lucknowensis TaxID=176173 RepID=A0ABR4LKP0_9EURO